MTIKYKEYFDKNGVQIKENMEIKHDDGEVELVYAGSENDLGEIELGVNASNENHANFTELTREIYPLSQFFLKEWEVVK